jgi:RNA polymerase sigma factor (sigma-70 family)
VSEEWVQQLAENPKDETAWLKFFEKLRPGVYYSVYRACRGDRELAADLTQEAFVRFYKYADLNRFRDDAQALAYLRQTARHQLLTLVAKEQPDLTSDPVTLENIPDVHSSAQSEAVEMEHDLEVLAQGLNLEERSFLARLLRGESLQEIAKRLDLSYGAAAMRLQRIKRKLATESGT